MEPSLKHGIDFQGPRPQAETELAAKPLDLGELRRIGSLGNHFISLQPSYEGRLHLFQATLSGPSYYVYKTGSTEI